MQATLLRSTVDAVLLVRHDVNGALWQLPGGPAYTGEPPHEAQARTLYEQTGLNLAARDVLVTDYSPPLPSVPEVTALVWDGGVLPDETVSSLATGPGAWLAQRFVLPADLGEFANAEETARIRSALEVAADPLAPRYRFRGAEVVHPTP
jgi:ADP-ribose pyrophosphatase YjhB (NUDIX family)